MTRESNLLLACLRGFVHPGRSKSANALLSEITDWPALFSLASQHGVTPLLYRFLNDARGIALPEACTSELRPGSMAGARHSLRFTSELLGVLSLFDLKDIPAIAFKGPSLAAELYGNLTLRDFSDIDILIRKQDVPRAKQALVAHGFSTDLPLDAGQEAAYLRVRYELHFTAPSGTVVEIHQAFLAPYSSFDFDYRALWRRLEKRNFCGREILALAPEDLLIALCAHGTKHGWSRLVWILDIARLLAVYGSRLDSGLVLTRAAGMGAVRMVLLGTLLARRILGAAAPSELLRQAQENAAVVRLARKVERSLFAPDGDAAQNDQSHRFFLQARERFRDKVTYCARLAFTPTEEDHSSFPLPGSLSALHYPLHAFRVLGKYGIASLKSLR